MKTGTLFAGLIFSSIGLGYFIYGRRQKRVASLLCGMLLLVIPYLISDIYLLIISAVLLMALPFIIKA